MARLIAEAVRPRTAMLDAANLGGMSLLAEPLRSFVIFVPDCMSEDTTFVACEGSLSMGQYMSPARGSVSPLATRFMLTTFGLRLVARARPCWLVRLGLAANGGG